MLAIGKRSTTAGHYVVVAGHMTVVGMAMATNERELFRNLCALATVLGEKRTKRCSRDRLEWPANFRRGIRFWIEHVLMRRPDFEEQEYASIGLRFRRTIRMRIGFE